MEKVLWCLLASTIVTMIIGRFMAGAKYITDQKAIDSFIQWEHEQSCIEDECDHCSKALFV